MRTRAERRNLNIKKAVRKKTISDEWFNDKHHYYDNLHQYSKNKIHCSCPCCSLKTRYKKNYGKVENWKHSDLRKIVALEEQIKN